MLKYSLILILFSSFFISCEKVIEIDINDEDQKIIIEGTVNKDSTEHFVKITRTLKFNENTAYPTVDNATVSISDNAGNSQTLSLVAPGTYKATNFLGVEGRIYTLSVSIDGNNYQSESTMPFNVPIDTLMYQEFSFGPTEIYYPIPSRMDPDDIKNYYSFNLYKNNLRIDGIFLQDDQFADGVEILQPVFGGEYETGDSLKLIMTCIDDKVYKYFYTLSINAGGTGGATPANPESNVSGGCLGYFSAQTKQILSAKIP